MQEASTLQNCTSLLSRRPHLASAIVWPISDRFDAGEGRYGAAAPESWVTCGAGAQRPECAAHLDCVLVGQQPGSSPSQMPVMVEAIRTPGAGRGDVEGHGVSAGPVEGGISVTEEGVGQ